MAMFTDVAMWAVAMRRHSVVASTEPRARKRRIMCRKEMERIYKQYWNLYTRDLRRQTKPDSRCSASS